MKRALFLIVAFGAAGCSGPPGSLGITGPGAPPPAAPAEDLAPAGVPSPGNTYGPSFGPMPSSNPRYFNYN